MIISLDTETTGVDFVHGAMPFLVTTCDDEGVVRFWEWDVDPLTRHPEIPDEEWGDIEAITELIDAADLIYLQNAKFDVRALATIGIELPWSKVRDTLAMGHLLASNHKHDLTWMCIEYLQANIEPFEEAVKGITKMARTFAKRDHPEWLIAEEGLPEMPSVKGSSKRDEDKPWKNDMWLPRALAKHGSKNYIPKHWLTACSEYANADSEHTLPLGLEMERRIRERGLWNIYLHRLDLPRVACEMECYGVTTIGDYTEATIRQYEEHVVESEQALVEIAASYGHDLQLAKGASINNNMREFFYDHLQLPKVYARGFISSSKEGQARNKGHVTLDKDAMQQYMATTSGAAYDFIKILTDKRKHGTDLSYMEGYRRYWVPTQARGFFRIHPSLNPFATAHLRWGSNSPNLQNVSKQESECEGCEGAGCEQCGGTGKSRMSVRYCFGPMPGREWYTMDYKSIEARIPAYESKEPKMMAVFEQPNDPPYWGNMYCLTASVLYPDKYTPLAAVRHDTEGSFKYRHPGLYKRSKFFVLAKQYGCGRAKGDLLAGISGTFDMVDQEFPLLAKLQAHYLERAERDGFVETMPDRTVDPERGYPILASRTEDGRVLSTTPFNYHVSGTACWCKNKALVRCSAQLAAWRADGFDAHMALEIHDEILFDFPRGATPEANRERAMVLRRLMEESGDDIGLPTPVSVEYHNASWAAGLAV